MLAQISKPDWQIFKPVREKALERGKELNMVFDHLRRSTALMQLASFRSLGLVTDDEYARFSAPTRDIVDDFGNRFRS